MTFLKIKLNLPRPQKAAHSRPAAAAHLTQVKPISFLSGPSHSRRRICFGFMCESQILCSAARNFEWAMSSISGLWLLSLLFLMAGQRRQMKSWFYQSLIKNELILRNFANPRRRHYFHLQQRHSWAARISCALSFIHSLLFCFSPFAATAGRGRTPRRRCTVTSCSTIPQEGVSPRGFNMYQTW